VEAESLHKQMKMESSWVLQEFGWKI